MIGTVLVNRYEILSEIGSGGMAKVYKAKCRYLQRIVAVKVLKEEFREDTEFLQRFDTEAQAAASLTHPNIVQIYDVGRDNNRYFIVMEYVEGITLKEYIEERGNLEWREAINISIQICSALSKAHSRHIIHRDIKPHNIMMNSDGVPKVADFGIARSVSNDTATVKIDTVGSVHYSSPEQVRGGYTDEKSDIYSIGVTIFEMVTGKLPFDGETPVAIALQHIQDEPPSPSSLNPVIPQALDHIILKCMAKSRQDRYDSVAELINDLENIRSKNGASEIVLPNVKHEGDKFSTKKFEKLGDEELSKNNRSKPSSSNKKTADSGGNSNRLLMGLLYFTLIAVILGGIGYFVKAVLGDIGIIPDPEQRPQEYVVGNYVGRDLDEVKSELELAGITPEIVFEFNEDVHTNAIISQSPPPDTNFKIGGMTSLRLVVSKGENLVEIPKVKYEEHTALKFKLQDELGLVVEEKSEYNEEIGSNYVIRSDPESGTKVKPGSKVTLYWSLGPEKKQVVVPDLKNYTYEQAVNKLLAEKLKLGKTFPEGREGYQGKIVDQAPKAGDTVTEDTAIDIFFEDNVSETGGSGGQQTGTNNKTIIVDLPGGYDFGDSVELRGLVIDNTTGDDYQLFNETVKTSDFPYPVVVPVPASGGVTFKIYVNDLLVNENTY